MPEAKSGFVKTVAFVTTLAILMAVLFYFSYAPHQSNPCSKLGAEFLVIANERGFNDSIDHGAPAQPWPVIQVHVGSNVTITVCNTDKNGEPHGFAVSQYYPNGVSVPAGSSVTVSFRADNAGNFTIFCNIFCSVHPYMVGELVVR